MLPWNKKPFFSYRDLSLVSMVLKVAKAWFLCFTMVMVTMVIFGSVFLNVNKMTQRRVLIVSKVKTECSA